MGNPMAQNLIKAGCDVTVWNRTKSKCEPIISLGAKYKASPEEVVASCDVTFSMLADPESAADAACGKYGAAKEMGPGKGYVIEFGSDSSQEVQQMHCLNVYKTSSSKGQSSQEDYQAYDEDESGDDSDSVNDSGSAHDSDNMNESED
ncbi:hypothetical protein KY290_024773 [Solanum tuberosum]|uniref:6-phosphogluconate dehydrogenase NADP-binding domain-containing protein n=1 Tax=Solanum tuberosum TaxID=4113 RepID=A0ABQ7URR0_SOLTU|nr:hypothetical protein KY284_025598 [Solanum tuberosum]KAH0754503.1 hypothetical protein KY290_024773 [Solanum tuberosum]